MSPSPTVNKEAELKLNQQIHDFLVKEGDFTDKKLNSGIILTARKASGTKLGLMPGNSIQGVLLDSRQKDDSLLLTVGLLDKNGDRFVTSVQLATYLYDALGGTGEIGYIGVQRPLVEIFVLRQDYTHGHATIESFYKNDEVVEKIKTLEGGIFMFIPYSNIEDIAYDGSGGEVGDRFVPELRSRVNLNKKLFDTIWTNGLKSSEDVSSLDPNTELIKIKSVDDINKVELDDVPILTGGFKYLDIVS